MSRVLKFEVPYKAPSGAYPDYVGVPVGSGILAVGVQPGVPSAHRAEPPDPIAVVWVLAHDGGKRVPRRLYHVLTGHELGTPPDRYVGTGQSFDGMGRPYVVHVFEAIWSSAAEEQRSEWIVREAERGL